MQAVPLVVAGLLIQAAAAQVPQPAAQTEAESALREGTLAQQHGDLKTAIADFKRAVALKPEAAEAHASLGAAFAAAGQFDDAIAEDNRALEANSLNMTVRRNLAQAYFRKGDLNRARIELEAVHAADPSDAQTAILLGYTYTKLSREADAVTLLKPLELGRQDDFQFEYVYAYALITSGKQDDGIPRMEKLARTKNSAEAWLLAGSARFYQGDMIAARDDLDASLKLNPDLPGLQTMAGQARYGAKDMVAAEGAFQAALRANPMDFVANRDLGAMRLREGDSQNAKPLLELAFQLQPKDPLTRLEIAKLDDVTGKYAEAAAILEQLVNENPGWHEAHWLLAGIYTEMNRPEDSKRERSVAHEIELKRKRNPQ